jgi:hypothetical protein
MSEERLWRLTMPKCGRCHHAYLLHTERTGCVVCAGRARPCPSWVEPPADGPEPVIIEGWRGVGAYVPSPRERAMAGRGKRS